MVPAPRGAQAQSLSDPSRPAEERTPNVTLDVFDFAGPVPLRNSYIVASTPRCGSTFLCTELWQTGVLGAPLEYWNCQKRGAKRRIGTRMMERLEASSPADYLAKLLACRTTRNGIFGVKVHFSHFETTLREFPQVLDHLSPVTFIYIERLDEIAQAVSLARSLQTGVWVSWRKRQQSTVGYDSELITRCRGYIEKQKLGWRRWFAANGIDPYVVSYEQLVANRTGVVSGIVELLGAANDEPQEVRQQTSEKQSDGTSKEWAVRYRKEIADGAGRREADAPALVRGRAPGSAGRPAAREPENLHFFDQYDPVKSAVAIGKDRSLGVFSAKRRRNRYEAIIAQNRQLFHNAKLLEIQCGSGQWSLAALDAGAAFVIGLDRRRQPVATAMKAFGKFGVKRESYELTAQPILPALEGFRPGEFDLILCQDFSWLSDLHFFFQQLHRLRPKHVILDTAINARKKPAVSFRLTSFKARGNDPANMAQRHRFGAIVALPSHSMIEMLCDRFGFHLRFVDWKSLGVTNWVGITDYEHDRRRTYVLERIS